jgi:hypothetical protein
MKSSEVVDFIQENINKLIVAERSELLEGIDELDVSDPERYEILNMVEGINYISEKINDYLFITSDCYKLSE